MFIAAASGARVERRWLFSLILCSWYVIGLASAGHQGPANGVSPREGRQEAESAPWGRRPAAAGGDGWGRAWPANLSCEE